MTRKRWIIVGLVVLAVGGGLYWYFGGHPPPQRDPVIAVVGTDKPDRSADVVFVHGLGGDGVDTWHPDNQPDKFWPRWLGEDLPDVAVWSVHYDAAPAKFSGRAMPLQDRATNVLDRLEIRGIGTGRPVLFVAHSLGGLVVKEMLRRAATHNNPAWKRIADNTRGVAFLATPHTGSDVATLTKYLNDILRLHQTNVTIDDLQANAAVLRELNEWYRNNAAAMGIGTLVLFEKYDLHGVRVVNESSADPGMTGVHPHPMEADHASICKPTSRQSDVYLQVLRFVRERGDPPGDVKKWERVDLSRGVPPHLQCVREPLLGETGPLSPAAHNVVTKAREANGYRLPDVDRFAFESDLLSRRLSPPAVAVPKGVEAKLVVYVLDEQDGHCRVLRDPDDFHAGGPVSWDREAVKGRVRLVAFVYPLNKAAYDYFDGNGFGVAVAPGR